MDKTNQKVVYTNCPKDGHEYEPLSRVCIDKKCSNKTLVCSICEELEHKTHKTIPLKTIVQKINESFNYEKEGLRPLYYTKTIDDIRYRFFMMLAEKKTEIQSYFEELETAGKIYFQELEQTTLSLLNVDRPENYFTGDSKHLKKAKSYLNRMLQLIDLEQKTPFSLQKSLESLLENCREKEKRTINRVNQLSLDFSNKSAQLIQELAKNSNITQKLKKVPFYWSPDMKGGKVKINEAIAQQTGSQSSGQRFALIEPGMSIFKKYQWGIKIKKFSGWIGVGICLKNAITKANYHFNYTTIGHGSYLISTNGYSWSHSVKEFNSAYKTFQFTVNDTVFMEYDPVACKLRFKKNSGNDKFELTIQAPPEGDIYHPCVNLCNNGDIVEIINQGVSLS